MGQKPIKAGLEIRRKARGIIDQVSLKFSPVSELKSLTYDEFLHEIQLLNKVVDELTTAEDKTVIFSVRGGTEVNFFWKVSSRIVCEKVNRHDGFVVSSKLLSVRRFIRLYADIMHQLSAAATPTGQDTSTKQDGEPLSPALSSPQDDLSSPPLFCASLILDGIDRTSELLSSFDDGDDEKSDECCICMERECQVMLSCAHGYCEECIKEWAEMSTPHRIENNDSTCPLCRNPIKDASHHWVLPQPGIPPSADEMPALVLGLVERAEGSISTASCAAGSCESTSSTVTSHSNPAESFQEERPAGDTDSLISTETDDGFTLVSHAPLPPT